MKYDVHLYTVVRVKMANIAAENQIEAIRTALDDFREEDVRHGEYANEFVGYLVDEVGDDEFKNSVSYPEMPNGLHCKVSKLGES